MINVTSDAVMLLETTVDANDREGDGRGELTRARLLPAGEGELPPVDAGGVKTGVADGGVTVTGDAGAGGRGDEARRGEDGDCVLMCKTATIIF